MYVGSSLNRRKTFYVIYMVFQQVLAVKSQIVSENSMIRKKSKFCIWIFALKIHDFWGFFDAKITWTILNFCAKNYNFEFSRQKLLKTDSTKLLNFDNFWRKKSNCDRNQCFKITKMHFWHENSNSQFCHFFCKFNFWTQFEIF